MPEIDSPEPSSVTMPSPLSTSMITLMMGIGIVSYLTWYNQRTWINDEFLVLNITFLLLFPILTILLLFKRPVNEFGFQLPDKSTRKICWTFLAIMIPIVIIASRFQAFQTTYPLRPTAVTDVYYLLFWESVYGMYMFSWEFFYRGFLTFGLNLKFGFWPAIVLQTLAFGLMHYGKPTPEFISSFFGGAALGWLSLRSKSFLPAFGIHWAVSVLMDILSIHGKPNAIF